MMRINIDVVIANCMMTLDELNQLQEGQMKILDNFAQSEVVLKSGNEILGTGLLVKVDEQYCVAIDKLNLIN